MYIPVHIFLSIGHIIAKKVFIFFFNKLLTYNMLYFYYKINCHGNVIIKHDYLEFEDIYNVFNI